jgi:chemotaxis protein methyltransferase CheR
MVLESSFEVNFPQTKLLNNWIKTAFLRLIVEEMGLEIKKHDQASLDAKIFSRMKALKIFFPENYYQLLVSKTVESRQEWQNLVLLLTNSESFFFRDKGHFQLLENYIIPELIQRKQTDRTIRICSAGCSTGEEPYSLAILFKKLIPDLDQWNLLILGLDVNPLSLEKAKAGIYQPWSFRNVAPEIKEQYFKIINDKYHINSEIKQMLKFQTLNLVKDSYPNINSEMREMDLIICRNVFIYFEETAVSKVLEKFYHTLQSSGCLLTGHTELYAQNLSKFQSTLFPEGMIYQRLDSTSSIPSQSKDQVEISVSEDIDEKFEEVRDQEISIIQSNIQDSKSHFYISNLGFNPADTYPPKANYDSSRNENDERNLLRSTEILMQKKAYNLAISQVEKALEINPKNFYSYYLTAQLSNYLNDPKKATFFCYKALEIDASSILPYFILVNIAEKQEAWLEVKKILKKIIYLEPESVAAYLKLSYIYQAENDIERTYKLQNAALNLLKKLPGNMEVFELDCLTVNQLILQLETTL